MSAGFCPGVIFFLLATFVLFTLSLNKTKSVPLDLPYGGDGPEAEKVTIQVSDANAVYWNQDPTSLAEIPARIAQYRSQTQSPRILITGMTGPNSG